MQIQELINEAFMQATSGPYPRNEHALVVFNTRQLTDYTELIIKAAVAQTIKLEGKLLDD